MLMELSMELGAVKGKKSYGYLNKRVKEKVDRIVSRKMWYVLWLQIRRRHGYGKTESAG